MSNINLTIDLETAKHLRALIEAHFCKMSQKRKELLEPFSNELEIAIAKNVSGQQ